jgi:hypothetical protein
VSNRIVVLEFSWLSESIEYGTDWHFSVIGRFSNIQVKTSIVFSSRCNCSEYL